jgi:competence protein ComEC
MVPAITSIFASYAVMCDQRAAKGFAALEKWLDSERDQLPLWLPVGVGSGIAIWQFTGNEGAPILALFCVAMCLIGCSLKPGDRSRQIVFVVAIALATGFGAIAVKSATVAQPVLGRIWIGEFYGRIGKVEIMSARDVVRMELMTDGYQGLPRKVRVNLSPVQYKKEFATGAVIKLRARLMPPAGPQLPGGYDFARRAWFQQIGATGSALGEVSLYRKAPFAPLFSTSRTDLTHHILNEMPADSGAIGAALVTGDQGHISEQDAQAMRDSGMAHLLSISGLHVTAVVGFIFFIVSRTLSLFPWLALRVRIPLIAATVAAGGAVAYTLLAGAEVPTVRSCVAALLILAALALGRDALTLRLVAFGAMIVLLFWPEAMAGPSFQLSFAAVATIVAFHELPFMQRLIARRDEPLYLKIVRNVGSLILTGLAIELILAPIALFHFHKTGIYGALANVVAIPLTTFFIMPMEAMALLLDLAGMGGIFWWLAGQGITVILHLAYTVSSLPGSVWMLPAMPGWAFGSIVIGTSIFGLLKTNTRYFGVMAFAIGLAAIITAPRPDFSVTGDGKHVAIADAQGNVSLLRSKAGDYVRDMLLENVGTNSLPVPIENWPGTRCSPDICVISMDRAGRRWTLLATRTSYQVPSMEMAAACKRVDIVVSDRWLPSSCQPRWIKADRKMLETNGGLSFYLAEGRLLNVNSDNSHMPWVQAARDAKSRDAKSQAAIVQ